MPRALPPRPQARARMPYKSLEPVRTAPKLSPGRAHDVVAKPAPPGLAPSKIVPKTGVAGPKKKPASLSALAVASAVAKPEPIKPAAPLAARVPIDMELPGEASVTHFEGLKRRVKRRGLRRQAIQGLAMAMVLLITVGGLVISQNLHKVFRGDAGTAAALKENVDPGLLKGEGRGRINILLLGRGGAGHEAPDLTDTMMLASIDPVNRTITLLSLPRDLWVNVPDHGVMKLNAAWQTGEFKYLGATSPGSTNPKAVRAGFNSVDQTVKDVLDIDIDYHLIVDFKAFQTAVDAVGGVQVNVPQDLVDPTMAWENKSNPTLAKAGTQAFNGKRALMYVRSRATTNDYARTERQRAVLMALKGRVESLGTLSNPFKLSSLFNAFGSNVQTDLSLRNLNRLYGILKKVSGANITSIGLNDTDMPGAVRYVAGGNINGQSIVLPKAGLFQYDAIHQYIRGQLKDPYIIKEKARIVVLNGTTVESLATTKADELKSYGYNVVRIGNTPNAGWIKTTLVDLRKGKNKYTKNYLEQRLGVKAASSLGDPSIPTNGADFVIIVGTDEATPS